MKIGELAKRAGITADTLRFYERIGLIRPARTLNGYREYPEELLELIRYISTAKKLGFTLAEIGAQIPDMKSHPDAAAALKTLFDAKAQMIGERITALQQLQAELLARAGTSCPLLSMPHDEGQ